jgi:F0F1-type ATP synthase assembly protein I
MQAKDSLSVTLRKTLLIQAALTGLAAIVALLVKTPAFALALVYGGAVTSIGTGLQAWRLLKIATMNDDNEPTVGHVSGQLSVGTEVFKGAMLKIGSMILLLALGMGYLKLDALAVIIGFTVAYAGFLFAGGYAPRSPRR